MAATLTSVKEGGAALWEGNVGHCSSPKEALDTLDVARCCPTGGKHEWRGCCVTIARGDCVVGGLAGHRGGRVGYTTLDQPLHTLHVTICCGGTQRCHI